MNKNRHELDTRCVCAHRDGHTHTRAHLLTHKHIPKSTYTCTHIFVYMHTHTEPLTSTLI